ncbi:site-specific integrase [Fodinibius sp. Rm-B-1B1-1]|jgi:site-specific recombinase XerD|uniref:tyrosine-type recombinase/integrase n=1 Tax=Fodinibius alkaliphilus TaxID=3140241 RepID=UPI00315A5CF5
MASLTKRSGNYSIVFKTTLNGKSYKKTYALGTKYKKIAEQKKLEYEKLYDAGKINPFDDDWNLQEYEKEQELDGTSLTSPVINTLQRQFLKDKTNVTEQTKKTYRQVISQFMEQVGYSMPVTMINTNDIKKFCLKPHLANASKKNYLIHLKAFFNWIVDKEILESNPCDNIGLPKTRDNLVDKIIDEAQLKEIFEKFKAYQKKHQESGAIKTDQQKQHWFIPLITLAFYTGLRRKEIIQLRWEHVNLEDRFLRVTDTKNGYERTVPIFDNLYTELKQWHKFNENPKNGLVFPSPMSVPNGEKALMGDNVSKRFKYFATKEAKLKDSIHFHSLRHSCATFLLRNGFNVIEVKNMLGHKSLEVTNKYVHLVPNDLLNTANRNGLIT